MQPKLLHIIYLIVSVELLEDFTECTSNCMSNSGGGAVGLIFPYSTCDAATF